MSRLISRVAVVVAVAPFVGTLAFAGCASERPRVSTATRLAVDGAADFAGDMSAVRAASARAMTKLGYEVVDVGTAGHDVAPASTAPPPTP